LSIKPFVVPHGKAVACSVVDGDSPVVLVEAALEESLVVPAWGLDELDRLSSSMEESEAAQHCVVVPLAATHS